MRLLQEHKDEIITLCEKHKVDELFAFGSVLTDAFTKESDIDFLVKFENVDLNDYFDNYMELKEELEQLFHRPVDLVENQAIRNPIFRMVIEREKQLIYERKSA